jgi:hypothetical protein
MKWRRTAGFLAVLILSIGTVFSGLHRHNGDPIAGDQQCTACLWHTLAKFDIADNSVKITAPERTVTEFLEPVIHDRAASPVPLFPRGPPSLS